MADHKTGEPKMDANSIMQNLGIEHADLMDEASRTKAFHDALAKIPHEEPAGSDPLFKKAMKAVPLCDIAEVRTRQMQEEIDMPDYMIRALLVTNRWDNPICEQCGNKREVDKLKRCMRCCLAFYCNSECQRKHWPTHKKRCGKPDGPLDTGYQRLVFVDLKTGERKTPAHE